MHTAVIVVSISDSSNSLSLHLTPSSPLRHCVRRARYCTTLHCNLRASQCRSFVDHQTLTPFQVYFQPFSNPLYHSVANPVSPPLTARHRRAQSSPLPQALPLIPPRPLIHLVDARLQLHCPRKRSRSSLHQANYSQVMPRKCNARNVPLTSV